MVEEPVTGWRVVRDGATTVALDLEVTGAAPGGAGPRPGPGRAGPPQELGWTWPTGSSWRSRPTARSPTRSPPTATTCSARPWRPASTAPPGRRRRRPRRPGRPGGPPVAPPGPDGRRRAAVTGPGQGRPAGPTAGSGGRPGGPGAGGAVAVGLCLGRPEQPGRAAGGADHAEAAGPVARGAAVRGRRQRAGPVPALAGVRRHHPGARDRDQPAGQRRPPGPRARARGPGRALGPLYYPAYLLGSLGGYRRNPFERGARRAADVLQATLEERGRGRR